MTPTEDTPAPNVNKTGHSVDIASANVNSKQLREALENLKVPKMITWVDVDKELKVETTTLTEKSVDEILALFTTAQIQLVSELEGEAVDEYGLTDCGGVDMGCERICIGHRVVVRSAVPLSVLEHKKQELERLQ